MRVMIESTDRVGISQEILGIFAQQTWNLKKVEIISRYTYAYVEHKALTLTQIQRCLSPIQGFITVTEIALLPSEQRENHLQALLAKIPEPIIDLDKNGIVLAVNQAAEDIFNQQQQLFIGKPLEVLFKQGTNLTISETASSQTVTINSKAYIADITPVFSSHSKDEQQKISKQLTGAVLVLRTMNSLGRQISLMQSHQENGFDAIIGKSNKISLIKEQSKRYAQLDLPVLIIGETGTGKELIARALHQASPRAKHAFLALNCAALPEHLLESELFGYASGAFTGASKGGKPGLIELAEEGSLFLDEIAEMSPYLQAKLLRFLQDFTYRRVGGTKELTANVRIISASHQNLTELIAKKHFREDLFYRINVLNLMLPPLRERVKDIEMLAKFFIKNAVKQVNSYQRNEQQSVLNSEQTSIQSRKTSKSVIDGKTNFIPKLNEQALILLQNYAWPGNIRQLQNVLFSTVALNKNTEITAADLQQALVKFTSIRKDLPTEKNDFPAVKDWSDAQAIFEKRLLSSLYPQYPTTRKLAERLNVSHNKIAMKLREHDIK